MTLIGTLPYSLSVVSSGSDLYTPGEIAYNYAIGGLPFLSAASKETPYIRSTAPFRKQQFDSSSEPGEQSLDGWWLRSQPTFHGGAGQLYFDAASSDNAFSETRFYKSKGVDPWTPGEVKLLFDVDTLTSSYCSTKIAWCGGTSSRLMVLVGADTTGTSATIVQNFGTVSTETFAGIPGFSSALDVATNGERWFVCTTQVVYSRLVTDAPGSAWTSIYNTKLAADPSYPSSIVLGWAKERLVMATTYGIYELTDYNGPVTDPPTPVWTPPQGSWTPKGVAESGSAIYVAGELNNGSSVILKFTLDASGAMPVLTSGTTVAALPIGEQILSIFGYLGKYLAIGTTHGPRIAEIDSNGDLSLGPLLFSGRVENWAATGGYLYAAASDLEDWGDGEAGLVRIDPGLQHDTLRFAYATDAYASGLTSSAKANAVGIYAGALVIASNEGLFQQSDSAYVESGWIQGSRIRYGTLEPKIYKLLRIRGPVLESDFFASVVDPDGAEHDVIGYVAGQTPGESDAAIPELGPLDYLSVKLTLMSAASNTLSTVTGGYQLKAIPGQPRQRQLTIPLQCFDLEEDRTGQQVGGQGTALPRLFALEAIEETGDTLILQDFDAGTADLVMIDNIQFTQVTRPGGTPTDPNFGGIIVLTVRTV